MSALRGSGKPCILHRELRNAYMLIFSQLLLDSVQNILRTESKSGWTAAAPFTSSAATMLLHRSSIVVPGPIGAHHKSHLHLSRRNVQWAPDLHVGKFRFVAALASVQTAPVLKSGMQGSVDPVYLAAANYLKSIGFTNTAEIARVLDIAMNPNSLFVRYNDAKRSTNVNARVLSVEGDMQPVVGYLVSQGFTGPQVVQVVTAHPPVLSYHVQQRLEPFWDYLSSIGVTDVAAAVVKRPSLLGLDVDINLRKIVDYLQYVETPPEKIVEYITSTI